MDERFQHKYRIPSARLQCWNYNSQAAYFITICTQNREHFLGQIVQTPQGSEQQMQLSELGKIVEEEWLRTPTLRPDMHLEMGAFVVMPNHFHGILIIGENLHNAPPALPNEASVFNANKFGPQRKNLASIVRGFKSSVTRRSKEIGGSPFGWQPSYHEHVIRNAESFEQIQHYIQNNPATWKKDKFYSSARYT